MKYSNVTQQTGERSTEKMRRPLLLQRLAIIREVPLPFSTKMSLMGYWAS